MKWIGLSLLAASLVTAIVGGPWVHLGALGSAILAYWHFMDREAPTISPQIDDFAAFPANGQELSGSSTAFDFDSLKPFLVRLSVHIGGAYNEVAINHINTLASTLAQDEEQDLSYEVLFRNEHVPLHIRLFKDDAEEVAVYFNTVKPLAEVIDREIEKFFSERGI